MAGQHSLRRSIESLICLGQNQPYNRASAHSFCRSRRCKAAVGNLGDRLTRSDALGRGSRPVVPRVLAVSSMMTLAMMMTTIKRANRCTSVLDSKALCERRRGPARGTAEGEPKRDRATICGYARSIFLSFSLSMHTIGDMPPTPLTRLCRDKQVQATCRFPQKPPQRSRELTGRRLRRRIPYERTSKRARRGIGTSGQTSPS